jgi:DNA polymerase elongation subunit (family B)
MTEIQVRPYIWEEKDVDGHLELHAWTMDKDNQPVLVRIQGFPVVVLLELPERDTRGRHISWNNDIVTSLYLKLLEKLGTITPRGYRISQARKLYYYNQPNHSFLKLYFNSLEEAWKVVKMFDVYRPRDGSPAKPKTITLKLSSDIYLTMSLTVHEKPSVIPMIRRFLVHINSSYTSWFKGPAKPVTGQAKLSVIDEYTMHWQDYQKVDREDIPMPLILSFDVEAYSENPKGFPVPYLARNEAFQVSMVFSRYKSKERKKILVGIGQYDPIEDTEVIAVKDEDELLDKFQELIVEYNPDLVIGYNTYGFDYGFLSRRLEIRLRDWRNLGRLRHGVTKLESTSFKVETQVRVTHWFLSMDGRVNLDVYHYVKQSHKLQKYSLDAVGTAMLGRGKHPVTPKDIFASYDAYQREPENADNIAELTRVGAYCVEDSVLVLDLYEHFSVWEGMVQMSNTVHIPMTAIYTRGTQIRSISLLYEYTHKNGIVMTSRREKKIGYKGAHNWAKERSIVEDVICLDVKSLYPSIIIKYNICYTTIISPRDYKKVPDEHCHVITLNNGKIVKFIKAEHYEGLFPRLSKMLLSERGKAKKMMAKYPSDDVMHVVYDKQQLALKLCANSLYGFLGVQDKGDFPLIEAAESVTKKGYEIITEANIWLERRYNAILAYNDTDSTLVSLPSYRGRDAVLIGKRLETEISNHFGGGIVFELEKVGTMIIFSPKMYSFWPYYLEGEKMGQLMPEEDIIHKGHLASRREQCNFIRPLFIQLLIMAMTHKPMEEFYDYVIEHYIRLATRQVQLDELILVQGNSGNYSNESSMMAVFTRRLRQSGYDVAPGDRLSYVITEQPGATNKGEMAMLAEHFDPSKDRINVIEYMHATSVQKCFQVAYGEQVEQVEKKLERHRYRVFFKKLYEKLSHVRNSQKYLEILDDVLSERTEEEAYEYLNEEINKKKPEKGQKKTYILPKTHFNKCRKWVNKRSYMHLLPTSDFVDDFKRFVAQRMKVLEEIKQRRVE